MKSFAKLYIAEDKLTDVNFIILQDKQNNVKNDRFQINNHSYDKVEYFKRRTLWLLLNSD